MDTTSENESVEKASVAILQAERSTQETLKGKLLRKQGYFYNRLLKNYPGIKAWLKTASKLIVELSLVVFMLASYAPGAAGTAAPVFDGQPNQAAATSVPFAEAGSLPNLTISNLNDLINKATTEEDKKNAQTEIAKVNNEAIELMPWLDGQEKTEYFIQQKDKNGYYAVGTDTGLFVVGKLKDGAMERVGGPVGSREDISGLHIEYFLPTEKRWQPWFEQIPGKPNDLNYYESDGTIITIKRELILIDNLKGHFEIAALESDVVFFSATNPEISADGIYRLSDGTEYKWSGTKWEKREKVTSPAQIGGGSGKFIIGLEKAEYAKKFPNLKGSINLFISNIDGTDLIPVTYGLKGYNYLQSISPDGTKVLVASCSDRYFQYHQYPNLYSINLNSLGSEPVRLVSGFHNLFNDYAIAKWINNEQVVYIGQGKVGYGIYLINSDGTNPRNIYKNISGKASQEPFNILGATDKRIYWYSGYRSHMGGNYWSVSQSYTWWSSMDGKEIGSLDFKGKQIVFTPIFHPIAISPDNTKIAWIQRSLRTDPNNYLQVAYLSDLDNAFQKETVTRYPFLRWWPDSSKILVYDLEAARNTNDWNLDTVFGLYSISLSESTPPTVRNENHSKILDILYPRNGPGCIGVLGDFSPDGYQLLVYLYDHLSNEHFCVTKANLLNMNTMTFTKILNDFTSRDVYWLP